MRKGAVLTAFSLVVLLGFTGGTTRRPPGHGASFQKPGDPQPVVGLYSVPAEACSLVAAAGFTVVHDYSFETRQWKSADYVEAARRYLDTAQRWNLRVLLGIPRHWARQEREADLAWAIQQLKSHPALFAWYEEEMFLNGDFEAVAFMDRVVRQNDPVHGFILEESKADERLVSLGRQRLFTWYPVTQKARQRRRLPAIEKRFPVSSMPRPPWPSLQIFGRDTVGGYPKRDFVHPTWNELSYCIHASLIAGSPAVFFYSYLQPTRYDTSRSEQELWPWVDYAALPEVSPELWRQAIRAAHYVTALLDWIAAAAPDSSDVVPQLRRDRQASWRRNDSRLLLVANPVYEPRSVVVPAAGHDRYRLLLPTGWSGWQPIDATDFTLEVPGPGGVAVILR